MKKTWRGKAFKRAKNHYMLSSLSPPALYSQLKVKGDLFIFVFKQSVCQFFNGKNKKSSNC